MKKIFTILASVILTSVVWAQSPGKMSYQAVIRDAANHLVVNHAVGMRITILKGSATGFPEYTEVKVPVTNENGLVTIEIGTGSGFSSIDWANGPYFLKTEIDPTGGSAYSIDGVSQLLSVPYAQHSKTAESAGFAVTEFDPLFNVWNKSTGISITATQVSDFQPAVSNNPSVLANTAKNSYPAADAAKLSGIAAGAEVNVNSDWNAADGDAQILNKPATVAGFGLTDAMTTAHAANSVTLDKINEWNTTFGWGNHASAGYLTGFSETDPLYSSWNKSSGILINASQVLDFQSGVSNNSAVLANTAKNSYPAADAVKLAGIADGAEVNVNTDWNAASGDAQLLNKPTTLSGFGITDAMTTAHAANAITAGTIADWNTAFGWGNHGTAGYLTSFTETDPVFAAWNKTTGISIVSSQVTDLQSSVTNNPAVLANTAKNSYPAADATKLAGIAAGAEVNVNTDWNAASGDAQLLNKPTTVAGFGITNAMTTAHAANAVTAGNIADWNTAFGWGDHGAQGYLENTSVTEAGDVMYYDGAVWVSKKLSVSNSPGASMPVNNLQPYLTVNYCIALEGIYPSRNGVEPFVGAIEINAFNFAPRGFATCDGQIMSIAQNTALFSLLGTTYGGNGQTTFALPDLRGRAAIHQGQGPGLSSYVMGQMSGSETFTLLQSNIPPHTHSIVYE